MISPDTAGTTPTLTLSSPAPGLRRSTVTSRRMPHPSPATPDSREAPHCRWKKLFCSRNKVVIYIIYQTQNVTNVNTSPKLSRRVSRQASLETDTPTLYGACASHAPRRQQARGPHEQLYYQDLRRRYGRQSSSEAGSGRGEAGHEKRRPVDCNKVRAMKHISQINS